MITDASRAKQVQTLEESYTSCTIPQIISKQHLEN